MKQFIYKSIIITLSSFLILVFLSIPVIAQNDSLSKEKALDHFLTGSVAEEAGDLLQAAVEYQLALLFDANSTTIYISLAKVYMQLRQPEAALKILEQGRKVNAQDDELLKMLAANYLMVGRRSEAAECYFEIAKLRQLERLELLRLAAILPSINRNDEALQAYQEYIARFGADIEIYQEIGLIHLSRNDAAAAETTFQRIVELDTSQHKVFFMLGRFAVNKDDWLVAERYFKKAIELDSMDVRYWINLILVLDEQDKNEEELIVIDAAINRFPDIALLYDLRCDAFQHQGNFVEALDAIKKSISLDSTRFSPYLARGYIHHRLTQWDEGADAYERALEIRPDYPVALNNYAYMLSEQNHRLEDAMNMVDRAIEQSPDNPSYVDTKAWILYRQGQPKEALKLVKKAMKDSDDSAELQEHIGFIYQALGKNNKAKKAWQKALELEPDNEKYMRLVR
ncbi:MAG: tetratricopeptide repeat protein [Candidatus Hatepunaea meridiana]|nr:tetratricopeptide repeat protein [Candidatus Hatepunaea meridiana]